MNRIKSFDFLKGIACFAVVMIHVPFPYPLNIFCGFYNHMAVPTFFLIAGYFAYKGDSVKCSIHLWKQAKNIFKIIISMFLLYGFYTVSLAIIQGRFTEWVEQYINIKTVRSILLFNNYDIIAGGQFWFLPVLLECYFLMMIINRYNAYRYIYKLLPFLILLYLLYMYLVDKYLISIDSKIGSFFLFNGFPLFSFGNYVAYKKQKNEEYKNNIVLLIFFMIIEVLYFITSFIDKGTEILRYVSIFGLISVFIFASNNVKSINRVVETIGEKYSMYVYLLHILVFLITKKVINHFGYMDAVIPQFFYPIASFIIPIVMGIIIEKKKNRINHLEY